TPGLINVDFADVRTIMKDAGTTVMGIGSASGDKRTIQAIKQAISSPLIETSIEGAKGVLLNIIGGPDLSMAEVDEAASVVAKTVDPDANIIFGAVVDKSMLDNVRVTVIATKVDDRGLKFVRPSVMREEKHEVKKLSEYDEVKEEEKLLDQSQETDGIDKDEEFDVPTFLRRRN
ncbi:MAG: cell division protein FtsZ, partial [Candidatus Paceibacterota bacterium]